MPNKDDLEIFFQSLDGALDQEHPKEGHLDRFSIKLERWAEASQDHTIGRKKRSYSHWYIAASLILLLSISGLIGMQLEHTRNDLTEYAPEISQASDHFENLISQRVLLLQAENTDVVKPVVEAAMVQLNDLEKDYQRLEQEVLSGANTELILNAMLRNFQTRIALIESVLEQIKQVKEIENDSKIL